MKWEVSISFPLQSKVKIEFVDRLSSREVGNFTGCLA